MQFIVYFSGAKMIQLSLHILFNNIATAIAATAITITTTATSTR
ncbi:MAG: hypothetical protein ABIN94_10700 [Ferruginibacter sp.]